MYKCHLYIITSQWKALGVLIYITKASSSGSTNYNVGVLICLSPNAYEIGEYYIG